jgi:hypothetical protein
LTKQLLGVAIQDNSRTFSIADFVDFTALLPKIKEYFAIFGSNPPHIANDNIKLRTAA